MQAVSDLADSEESLLGKPASAIMIPVMGTSPSPPDLDPNDERWKLVQRVAQSEPFRRAPRLREFLLFVCERALVNPGAELGEYEIGQCVFKRPATFNPAEDSIVRSSARQVRAKLQEYFLAAGRNEQKILEIPKGAYLPVFIPQPFQPKPEGSAPPPSVLKRNAIWILATLAIACAILAFLTVPGRRPVSRGATGLPPQDILSWVFGGKVDPISVVLCDSALVVVNSYRSRMITLDGYIRMEDQKALPLPPGNPRGATPPEFPGRRLITSFRDVAFLERLGEMSTKAGFRTQVRHSRLVQARDFRIGNHLILGSPWSNPWAALFQERLNFRFAQLEDGQFGVRNASPKPGERDFYTCRPEQARDGASYAVVALTKNLSGNGTVLIISGLHTESAEGAADAVLSLEFFNSVQKLAGNRPPVDLELLLEVIATDGVVKRISLLASRLPK